jgi:hypothetical protein
MHVAFFIVTHCHAAARARACSGPLQKDHRRRHQRCVTCRGGLRLPLAFAPLLRAFPANIWRPCIACRSICLTRPPARGFIPGDIFGVCVAPSLLNCRSFCHQTRLLFVPWRQRLHLPIPTRLRRHLSVLTPRAAACTCRTLPTTTPPTLSAGALLPRARLSHKIGHSIHPLRFQLCRSRHYTHVLEGQVRTLSTPLFLACSFISLITRPSTPSSLPFQSQLPFQTQPPPPPPPPPCSRAMTPADAFTTTTTTSAAFRSRFDRIDPSALPCSGARLPLPANALVVKWREHGTFFCALSGSAATFCPVSPLGHNEYEPIFRTCSVGKGLPISVVGHQISRPKTNSNKFTWPRWRLEQILVLN